MNAQDRGNLKLLGFRVEGLAETLYAFSVSESFRDYQNAISILAREAKEAGAAIAAHVDAQAAAARAAHGEKP